ncbi:hypothetical protein ACH4S8_27420 [Streptomyces sp. NPDC021080]|uniref:hypothetical protein n=1 Tax=Streptomyces sp. NPDC021080 TaxID=3365110 RepID=UPI00378EF8A7
MSVHQRTHWRRAPDGTRYRVRRTFPAGPAGATVLLAGPGSVSVMDGQERDDLLLEELTGRLAASGAQVLRCDLPVRDRGEPAGEADLLARATRLAGVLEAHAHLVVRPLVLVGFSLGGLALLHLLGTGVPRAADGVVLVGTVIEEDTFLTSRVTALDLVYGAFDLVGYLVDEARSPAVFTPDMYGPWSAGRLMGPRAPDVRVHLLEGLGHTLQPCGSGPARDAVAELASLVDREK